MAITTVELIESQINELPEKERTELLHRLNQRTPRVGENKEPTRNGKKGYVSPNTIWLRDHSAKYAGMYVAVKDGKFLDARPTLKELDISLKQLGVERPLRTYVPRENETFYWGGW